MFFKVKVEVNTVKTAKGNRGNYPQRSFVRSPVRVASILQGLGGVHGSHAAAKLCIHLFEELPFWPNPCSCAPWNPKIVHRKFFYIVIPSFGWTTLPTLGFSGKNLLPLIGWSPRACCCSPGILLIENFCCDTKLLAEYLPGPWFAFPNSHCKSDSPIHPGHGIGPIFTVMSYPTNNQSKHFPL